MAHVHKNDAKFGKKIELAESTKKSTTSGYKKSEIYAIYVKPLPHKPNFTGRDLLDAKVIRST